MAFNLGSIFGRTKSNPLSRAIESTKQSSLSNPTPSATVNKQTKPKPSQQPISSITNPTPSARPSRVTHHHHGGSSRYHPPAPKPQPTSNLNNITKPVYNKPTLKPKLTDVFKNKNQPRSKLAGIVNQTLNKQNRTSQVKTSGFNQFKSGFRNEASSFWKNTLHTPTIARGFRTIKKNPKQAYQNVYNKKTGSYYSLTRGIKKTTSDFKKSNFYKSPTLTTSQFLTHKVPAAVTKGAIGLVTYPFIKHSASDWGKTSFNVALTGAILGLDPLASAGDRFVANKLVSVGSKEVPISDFFTKEALKSSSGLELETSKKGLVKSLEKTKGLYKEYPEHYVATSSIPKPLEGTKILTKAEKKAKGLKVRRYDDPGFFVSSKGKGQPKFLNITKNKYQLSLGVKPTPSARPNIVEVLGKRIKSIPKSVLAKDKGFNEISDWQAKIAAKEPSSFIIPKRTEVRLGSPETKALIKKVDKYAIGTPENEFIIAPKVTVAPAKKLTPKNLLGRLKGYNKYVKYKGRNIPVKTKIILGDISEYSKLIGSSDKSTNLSLSNIKSKFLKPKKLTSGKSKTYESLVSKNKSEWNKFYKYYGKGSTKTINLDISKPILSQVRTPTKKSEYKYSKPSKIYKPITSVSSLYFKPSKPTKYTSIFSTTSYKPKPSIYKPKPYVVPTPKYITKYTGHGGSKPYKPTPYEPSPVKSVYKPTPIKPTKYSLKYKTETYPKPYSEKGYKTYYPLTSTTEKPKGIYRTPRSKNYSQKSKINLYKPYKIEIKSGGKWINVKTPKKLNYYSAWDKAASIVDTYKERSFRLVPSIGRASKIAKTYNTRRKRFYQPAKTKGLTDAFIEKSKYAINTRSELSGITYKGILAKKKKAKAKKKSKKQKNKSDWGIKL